MKKIAIFMMTHLAMMLRTGFRLGVRFFVRSVLGWQDSRVHVPEYRSHRVPDVQYKKDDPNAWKGELVSSQNLQPSSFEVADLIVTVPMKPSVGVINLRIYEGSKTIKRDVLINEPRLRAIMRGRRFNLSEVPIQGVYNLEEVKKTASKDAEELINRIGNANSSAQKVINDTVAAKEVQKPKVAKPTVDVGVKAEGPAPIQHKVDVPKAPTQSVMREPQPEEQSVREVKSVRPSGKVYTPTMIGHIYEGVLKRAGTKRMTPPGRAAYETFEAVLVLDNGAELPLRGAELEREISSNGCRVGDRVAIQPMGKVPVTLPDGEQRSKNLYHVRNLGADKERRA